MLVFYSVGGEGMGHATRSCAVIKNLIKKEKNLKFIIFSYDRAYEYLKQEFENNPNVIDIVKITGINFVYENNAFKFRKTVLKEFRKFYPLLFLNAITFYNYYKKYPADVIISDYEPTILLFAKVLKITSVAIENISFMHKCEIDYDRMNFRFKFLRMISNIGGKYNFIVTIFHEKIKKKYLKNTILVGPIIRDEVMKLKPYYGDYVLVYQTSASNKRLIDVLRNIKNEKFIVYGFHKNENYGNVILKKNSKDGFLKDLEGAKAVIINGGFSLLSEAIYLKKPILVEPIKNQIEQEVNAYYVEKTGIGMRTYRINEKIIKDFLNKHSKFINRLKKYQLYPTEPMYDTLIKIIKTSHVEQEYLRQKIKKKYFSPIGLLRLLFSLFHLIEKISLKIKEKSKNLIFLRQKIRKIFFIKRFKVKRLKRIKKFIPYKKVK